MSSVFVVNSGSSSIKYDLFDAATLHSVASGLLERIGEPGGDATDHTAGLEQVLAALPASDIIAVGHRVVHGGALFSGPTILTVPVIAEIERLSDLAPLHNPPNLLGIRAALTAMPHVPHVAIFDTAFHTTLPPAAYTYAIDRNLAAAHGVRRYGFHGTSHEYVSRTAADFLGRPLTELKTIVLHLGNGASAAAVDGGRSVDTSMGLTPLEGLVMGTRSGDIDPGILLHLARVAGLTVDQLDTLLNRRSGLAGLTGSSDMRDVVRLADNGNPDAALALDVWAHRLRHYIGAYAAVLGGLDAIVFTAGIGENNPALRARALEGLEFLGVRVDAARNESSSRDARLISPEGAAVAVLVIPTDEEHEIARQTLEAVRSAG